MPRSSAIREISTTSGRRSAGPTTPSEPCEPSEGCLTYVQRLREAGVRRQGVPLDSYVVKDVVQFRDGKMAAERIYWDQAAVLRQVGKL